MERSGNSSTTTPRRRPRLHPVSWVVLLLATFALAVIVLPGMPSEAGPEFIPPSPDLPMPAPWTLVQTWEHGWPWTFLSRGVAYPWSSVAARIGGTKPVSPEFEYDIAQDRTVLRRATRVLGEPVAWTTDVAWDLGGSDSPHWNYVALVADLVVGVGLVVAVGWLVERRIRRRGGVARWSLADLLIGIAVLSCCLGWYMRHEKRWLAHEEIAHLLAEFASGNEGPVGGRLLGFLSSLSTEPNKTPSHWGMEWNARITLEPPLRSRLTRPQWKWWRYAGPQWLARLCGSREALRPCWRLTYTQQTDRGAIGFAWGPQPYALAADDLSEITLVSPYCLIEDLAPLTRVDNLRRLTLAICATEEDVRRFAEVDLSGRVVVDPASQFMGRDRVALLRLRRRLALEGPEPRAADPRYLSLDPLDMTDELLRVYEPFLVEHVKELTFGPLSLTHEGWAIVGRSRHLEKLDTGMATLSGRELTELRPLLLRELSLRQGELTVAGLAKLASMQSLVALTVRDCTFTASEQTALRTALPAVEVVCAPRPPRSDNPSRIATRSGLRDPCRGSGRKLAPACFAPPTRAK